MLFRINFFSMKIMQIIFGLSAGGAERFVLDLSNELVREHEVVLLTLKDADTENNNFYLPELSDDVKYINAGIKKGFSIKKAFFLFKTIKSLRPDVVHIHLGSFYVILSILFYRKPKYIETIHSSADVITPNVFFFVVKFLIFKFGLVNVCAISDENRNGLQRKYKIKNPYLVYNGRKMPLVTSKFDCVRNEINELKNSPEDLVFIHIGRFVEAKNQDMLVSAFNQLDEIGYKFVLLIIGDGFHTQKAEKLRLMACPKIHFLGKRANIADYLHNSDGFCLSSIFEGMPISLIESFACGCIPICTPTSGSIDLIKNGVNGFLSNDFSQVEYINAIRNFIKQHAKIDKEELIMFYKNNFTIRKCAEQYNVIYYET